MNLSDAVGGAWIGGTVDTTGAVIAASDIISDDAKQVSAIVKMLQNCLIGPICLIIAIWYNYTHTNPNVKVSQTLFGKIRGYVWMLWDRFPKFVLGFFATSFIISFCMEYDDAWKNNTLHLALNLGSWFEV